MTLKMSYVWPPDYNWQRAPPILAHNHIGPTAPERPLFTSGDTGGGYEHNYQSTTSGMLLPWFVSMWLVGTSPPGSFNPGGSPLASVVTEPLTSLNSLTASSDNDRIGEDKFEVAFRWKQVDFLFPSLNAREEAMKRKDFIPANNLPLGLEIFEDKVFISLPRWKRGVPFTLAVVNRNDKNRSPPLRPFGKLSWHKVGDCNGFTSVFRMSMDRCGRLWVLDCGSIDLLESVNQICPAQIMVFDARTERLIWKYVIPKEQSPQDALFTNIIVDVTNGDCGDAFAYIADVFRYGLVVYSWKENKSWRINHPHFYPDPLVSRYDIDGIVFRWTDGIFGLALSPQHPTTGHRTLYFHPLSSFREFSVPTEILRDENRTKTEKDSYNTVGEPRGDRDSHSSGSAMDDKGILFYNMVTKNAVGCWNSNNGPHTKRSQGVVQQNNVTLSFPNDLKVDLDTEQNVWVLSNRLHRYLYSSLNPSEYNFRILRSSVKDAVRNTVCEHGAKIPPPRKSCSVRL